MTDRPQYLPYEKWNEYDLYNVDIIQKNDLTYDAFKTYYGDSNDEHLILRHKTKDIKFNFSSYDFKRAIQLISDTSFSPKLSNEINYKELIRTSFDHYIREDITIPPLELLIKHDIHICTHQNFRYYEKDINETSIHISKWRMYDSYDDVDWDWWHVILITGEDHKNGRYKIQGVPKNMFMKYREKGYLT